MNDSKNTVGRKNGKRHVGGACLALVILTIAAAILRPSFARASSRPPVSRCSDFACEQ